MIVDEQTFADEQIQNRIDDSQIWSLNIITMPSQSPDLQKRNTISKKKKKRSSYSSQDSNTIFRSWARSFLQAITIPDEQRKSYLESMTLLFLNQNSITMPLVSKRINFMQIYV